MAHAELSTMVARGRLERVAHGVYRVPQVAATAFDQYQLTVLWTGVPEACLSHNTALDVWDISDINPARVHATVGRHRRIRRSGRGRYVIHREDLKPEQITWWEGIRSVTVPTAIEQRIASLVPTYLIRQALARAGRTSLLPADERERLSRELEVPEGGA